MELIEVPADKEIMQHNVITTGRYDFSACQLDIMFMILASLGKDDNSNHTYTIHVQDIEYITGRKWNYQQLIRATEEMGSRVFTIETAKSLKQIWLFQSVEYIKGTGSFTVRLGEDARHYLFDLKNNFTVFQLRSALSCSSKYAKRLYTLCSKWKGSKNEYIKMSISELKEMLFLKDPKGKEPEQLTRISDFKKFVLDIAKKQINENTDIYFDYELVKRGRSFEDIKLFISTQKLKQLEIHFDDAQKLEFQKRIGIIKSYGISEPVAERIAQAQFEVFQDAVKVTLKAVKDKAIKGTAEGYLVGILKKKGVNI